MDPRPEDKYAADEKDVKNAFDEEHVEAAIVGDSKGKVLAEDFGQYVHDAAEAVEGQKNATIRAELKRWRKGIIYSVIFSTAIIMEGYDTMLLGQFFANQSFASRFGVFNETAGRWEIETKWQTGLSVGCQIGQILGLQITGWASDRYGYRPTMLFALICLTALLFLQFFASSLGMLLAGYILLGFPWGTFQTMTVTYAAEVMPINIRPYLTTYVNLCWIIGQIICSGVNRALISNTTQWAYRIPFAIQWFWPIPIFIGICLAPESPWWLTRQGRFQDAERAVMSLVSGVNTDFGKKQVAMMHHTNEMEKEAKVGTSFRACFQGTNLRRTEIACMVWLIQTLCGSPLMGNATYFFVAAGMTDETASTLNLIMYSVGFAGTVSSWFLMKPFGRRSLYMWGQVILVSTMLITAILGTVDQSSEGAQWAIGALLILFAVVYQGSVGPVCYCLVSEMGSTRLRSKTTILARNLYNVGGVLVGILNPQMLNSTAWNLGARSAWLWAATGFVCLVWTFYRLPEPKGRSYGELDVLFETKVPARKFKTTHVDEFAAAERNAAEGVGAGAAMAH